MTNQDLTYVWMWAETKTTPDWVEMLPFCGGMTESQARQSIDFFELIYPKKRFQASAKKPKSAPAL